MTHELDLAVDWLADASLTEHQRRAWEVLRSELASARAKNQELHEKIQQFEQQQAELLPSVLNRPDFNREVARMLAFDERYGGMSSVLYFDFENLEEITSKLGASAASTALREIGVLLSHNVRNSDIVGRLAPDEFGVLLMHCDNSSAWKKAGILATLQQKALAEINGQETHIKVSYGAYTFREKEGLATGLKEAAHKMTSLA